MSKRPQSKKSREKAQSEQQNMASATFSTLPPRYKEWRPPLPPRACHTLFTRLHFLHPSRILSFHPVFTPFMFSINLGILIQPNGLSVTDLFEIFTSGVVYKLESSSSVWSTISF
ncbi:unnamed protein product [Vicia faba]|uniref:Uncharacterized protein n=1 Tax=Vicia faba TaxID=3906 RepID=A0AAV0ZFT7_VICFA|nr:unnamed protein product [Vicia faba]